MTDPIRVLLIEDNAADADLTRETLSSGKLRLEIEVQHDGELALDHLLACADNHQARPDLILLDLNLPKLDGQTLLARIRQHPALRRIPVVVLTSSDAEQDIARSYDLGANCYVAKPLGLQAFQTIVRAVEQFWFTVVKLP